ESDDAAKRLADILTKHKVRGCFCVVGDKARALVARGRRDVIGALRQHEIHYHTNTHGYWPRTAFFLEESEWDAGLAKLMASEVRGLDDIEHLFGQRPTAYAKPDSHWAARQIYGLRLLGLKLFASSPFEMPDSTPVWYMNSLNVRYHLMFERYYDKPSPFEAMKADFEALLTKRRGTDAPILIGTHPCMWVCKTFYDVHNVKVRGQLPPKEEWQPAPLRPRKEAERLFRFFDAFVGFLKRRRDVELTTYRGLIDAFAQSEGEWLTAAQVARLAKGIQANFTYQALESRSPELVRGPSPTSWGLQRCYSPAEIFSMLSWALTHSPRPGGLPGRIPLRRPIGPLAAPAPLTSAISVTGTDVVKACAEAEAQVENLNRVPSAIRIQGLDFSAASFLRAMADVFVSLQTQGRVPNQVALPVTPDVPEVADTVFKTMRLGAMSLPVDFKPDRIVRYARFQTWTAKPAQRMVDG
ncbi:MAG: hypothetical protein FJ272_07825, partial [Planctomycetes bacterium]|nr:hypothetical protein [Planctomycetota bacterium]